MIGNKKINFGATYFLWQTFKLPTVEMSTFKMSTKILKLIM
jgi:hypothetical protein